MATGRRGAGSRGGGRDHGPAGCLLWLIVFVFIFLLFALNWGKITETLDRTNFNEILRDQGLGTRTGTPADRAPTEATPVTPAARVEEPVTAPSGSAAQTPREAQPSPQDPRQPDPRVADQAAGGQTPGRPPEGQSPAAAAESAISEAQLPKHRVATLYFVRIDDDGVIVRQEVKRSIPMSDSPLADALQALVRGPNEDELRKRLVSLIPEGTKLLGVRLQGTTAVVNLSEAFMYNRYGIEGYAGQLKQVVFTATMFPTVHDVQILIEGERHDYLGGEGVYIGKPLSRNSF